MLWPGMRPPPVRPAALFTTSVRTSIRTRPTTGSSIAQYRTIKGNGIKGDAAKRFEALFGLHGNITIWADARTGIPIRIEGEAPVGPFDVSVRANLIRREGD